MDRNPEINHMLNNPDVLRQTMEIARWVKFLMQTFTSISSKTRTGLRITNYFSAPQEPGYDAGANEKPRQGYVKPRVHPRSVLSLNRILFYIDFVNYANDLS